MDKNRTEWSKWQPTVDERRSSRW
ncbi:uncharacterized protein G2W53_025558 [Senna tora]|uniref:Uncharacterized protein n=1 Tax=Senna tora TaxID=362788 RepID=A0A834TDT7_9FABA|nr:uncharacterized protein G2W53_025558 [Senna tora]